MRVISVIGTRPEAIKMAPVILALKQWPDIESIVCSTGQHREMLVPILDLFGIQPDHDLGVMQPGQTLNTLFSNTLAKAAALFEDIKPDRVLVHGDTTTAGAAALAAFHLNIPVGHVEAGLRTGNLKEPWPEELNRRLVDLVADQLFAPTQSAQENLLRENLGPKRILVTGNTVIDALLMIRDRINRDAALVRSIENGLPRLDPHKRLVLVTGHRRENFGDAFEQFCLGLKAIAQIPGIELVYPVHLNPNVQQPVNKILSGLHNVHLIAPLDYGSFVYLMDRAAIIISDSGGVQEEAPSLGKLVLVTRNVTERPEAIEAGTVELVGTDKDRILERCAFYLNNSEILQALSKVKNPYGDGQAAGRVVGELRRHLPS